MSATHVELVCLIFAPWERGEFGSAGWADPRIEYVRVGEAAPLRR